MGHHRSHQNGYSAAVSHLPQQQRATRAPPHPQRPTWHSRAEWCAYGKPFGLSDSPSEVAAATAKGTNAEPEVSPPAHGRPPRKLARSCRAAPHPCPLQRRRSPVRRGRCSEWSTSPEVTGATRGDALRRSRVPPPRGTRTPGYRPVEERFEGAEPMPEPPANRRLREARTEVFVTRPHARRGARPDLR